jgi:DNA-binding CsgD family transcriptional regulator
MNTFISTIQQPFLLQAVIEGFIDGILILSEKGEWIHANECARRICHQFTQGIVQSDRVPGEIWRTCQALMSSLNLYPNKTVIIEDEITTGNSTAYRVRAQWLTLKDNQRPCMLVTLEDRNQATQSIAIAEGQKFGLTPREADVWLRYRSNHTYKEIASELYITYNTVKKHMKNIHAKRQLVLADQQ